MKLTAELFQPHVEKDIVVHLDDGTRFPLTLTEVTPFGEAKPLDEQKAEPVHTAFALDLKGPPAPVIEALTYPISADWLDPTYVFLSPHAQDQDGTYYNIVIN